MTWIARAGSWLIFVLEAFFTVGPRQFRPRTGLEHHAEHFLALALLGVLFGLAYPRQSRVVAVVGMIVAAMLETIQLWRPGRHASFADFATNVLGLWAGLLAAVALRWLWQRVHTARQQT